MSTQTTQTTDAAETDTGGETDRQSRTRRVLSAVSRRGDSGTPAAIAGGTLLAAAVPAAARRQRRRAGAMAVAGVALLGIGLGRRRSDAGTPAGDGHQQGHSAEASAHRTASDLVGRSEVNPRDVSGGADVEAAADEGTIRFSTDRDETGEPKPHLDGADPVDPRYADAEDPAPDDHVEVSLSETKTTHELGKVAAPDEEQAYPASEGTDPEPMSEKSPPRYGEGAVANKGTGDEENESGEENGDGDGAREAAADGEDESDADDGSQ